MKYNNRNREHEHVYNFMILNYYSHYFIISCSHHTVHITLICRLNFIICAEDMYAYIKYVNIGMVCMISGFHLRSCIIFVGEYEEYCLSIQAIVSLLQWK